MVKEVVQSEEVEQSDGFYQCEKNVMFVFS